jgi:cation:H+ antiporter
MIYLQLGGGLVLLFLGGSVLVRGAVSVARRAGLSPLVIGLTLVGFGTSMPELLTSVDAALAGSPGIALGNVVGSNIANILLVLGVAALIYPIRVSSYAFRRDGALVLAASLICVGVFLFGELGRSIGLLLLGMLAAYLFWMYRQESDSGVSAAAQLAADADKERGWPDSLWLGILALIGGIVMTLVGARLMVGSSIALVEIAGLSETVIGLTIVAVGTSLPELVTSFVAAIRREADIALGNVIGSNIFNVLGILGTTVVVQPLSVPPELFSLDVWVMLAATVFLVIFSVSEWRISRPEGAALLGAYGLYVGYLVAAAG